MIVSLTYDKKGASCFRKQININFKISYISEHSMKTRLGKNKVGVLGKMTQ